MTTLSYKNLSLNKISEKCRKQSKNTINFIFFHNLIKIKFNHLIPVYNYIMDNNSIPKIIFQTWKTKDVPEQWKDAQKSVIEKNKNFRYVLLTDEDNHAIVKQHFPTFLPYFENFEYNIQRADAIRYVVLYIYGGIYLDLDYVALQPFDELTKMLDDDDKLKVGLLKTDTNARTNSFMMSKPRSTFWLECIEEMKKPTSWFMILRHLKVFYSTGPFMVNRVCKLNQEKVKMLNSISVPCNICFSQEKCLDEIIKDKHYIMPIEGKSWNTWDTTIWNFFYCNRNLLMHLFLMLVVVLIFLKLYFRCQKLDIV